jgi:hypothetical protein
MSGDHVEAYFIGVIVALTILGLGFVFSVAAMWSMRVSFAKEVALLRADILGNLAEVRREATVRRVIKTLDEVPPELLSPVAREHIAEVMALTKRGPVPVVRAAIDMGVVQSKIGRELNQLDPDDHEEAGPAGPDDPCPEDEDDEPVN